MHGAGSSRGVTKRKIEDEEKVLITLRQSLLSMLSRSVSPRPAKGDLREVCNSYSPQSNSVMITVKDIALADSLTEKSIRWYKKLLEIERVQLFAEKEKDLKDTDKENDDEIPEIQPASDLVKVSGISSANNSSSSNTDNENAIANEDMPYESAFNYEVDGTSYSRYEKILGIPPPFSDADDDWEENEGLLFEDDLHNEIANLFEAAVGQILLEELMELALEDEEDMVLELVYGRNVRAIDWRAELPRMEYLRSIEDPYFLKHFRMDRETFEVLLVVMGNYLVENNQLIRLRTEIDKCLLMVLWILANLDTYRATSITFGVSSGTVHFHCVVVIQALRKLASRYIKCSPRIIDFSLKKMVQS